MLTYRIDTDAEQEKLAALAAARALIEPLTGYTPGPWRCSRADLASFDAETGVRVSFLYPGDGERVRFETDNPVEDARLSAAAPELHSALAATLDEIERLTTEVERLTKGSICEVAATNPSVMEYMRHWEGRAEKAENRAYTLAYAIAGGEDAPGLLDSIPTQELTAMMSKERASNRDWTEACERQAWNDAIEAAAEVAETTLIGDTLSPSRRISSAIRALTPADARAALATQEDRDA